MQQSLTGETFDNYKYKYVQVTNLGVLDNNKEREKKASPTQQQVVAVCMRARHNHLDIWFKNVDRFRCLSSYLQVRLAYDFLQLWGQHFVNVFFLEICRPLPMK